jgi:hypothetical protein
VSRAARSIARSGSRSNNGDRNRVRKLTAPMRVSRYIGWLLRLPRWRSKSQTIRDLGGSDPLLVCAFAGHKALLCCIAEWQRCSAERREHWRWPIAICTKLESGAAKRRRKRKQGAFWETRSCRAACRSTAAKRMSDSYLSICRRRCYRSAAFTKDSRSDLLFAGGG